jgi:Flp pilus assembly protein TadD
MLRKDWRISVRPLACLAAAVGVAALVGACTDTTHPFSLDGPSQPLLSQKAAGKSADLEALAAAHTADRSNTKAALAYAKALRLSGARTDAMAVLESAARAKPNDRQVTLERGLLALELGDTASAETLLRAAFDPKAPDWRLHSALGAALASRGKQSEAQAQFAKALALAPDHPSILNNLALSYALDGKAAEAEKLLRKAATAKEAADADRMQQNLALVLGLGGKFAEARSAAEATLPADKASQNVAYLQKLAAARAAAKPESPPAHKEAFADLLQPVYRLGAQPPAK